MSDITKDEVLHMLELHGMNLRKINAWTRAYRAFVMGGSVHYALVSEFDCDYPVPLGKGFYGSIIQGPRGITRVCELTSGAIIGDTIEDVRRDIEACEDIEYMQKQVRDGQAFKESANEIVSNEEFWKRQRVI